MPWSCAHPMQRSTALRLFSPHAADPFMTYEEMRDRMRPLLGENGVHLSPFLSRRSLLRGQDMGQSPAGDSFPFASGVLWACSIILKYDEPISQQTWRCCKTFTLTQAAVASDGQRVLSIHCHCPPAGSTSRS